MSHALKSPTARRLWPFVAAPPLERVASLDALRGLMAVFVAIYHHAVWTQAFAFDTTLNGAITVLGVYSVEGFFIISGFCFFHVYRETIFDARELRGFYVKRFARIAPVYYLAVALNLALDQRVGPFFSWIKLLENATLTFGLVHPNHAMVLGGWSIGIEYVFYLVFPWFASRLRSPAILYPCTLVLTALAWPFIFDKVGSQPEAERFHAYVQIQNHAFLFAWGAVLAELYTRAALRFRTGVVVLSCLALLVALAKTAPVDPDHFVVMVGWPRVSYLLGCLALVSLFAFAAPPNRAAISERLGSTADRVFHLVRTCAIRLGDLSYAVYLLHPFAWLLTRELVSDDLRALTACGLSLSLTVVLAWIVHQTIEKPALRYGKRIANAHASAKPGTHRRLAELNQ